MEALLTGEEATIVAASAEALALAKAAVEVAKDAARMEGSDTSVKLDRPKNFPSKPDMILLERVRLAEMESLGKANDSATPETGPLEGQTTPSASEDDGVSSLLHSELELQEVQHSECIAVRSRRQTERRARRARAAAKTASRVISVESGSSSKKKRSTIQEIDYSDPLRYLRATTSTSKLLTASEELELSHGIQVWSQTLET